VPKLFKLCPTDFYRGGNNFSTGSFAPLVTGLAGTGSLSTAWGKLYAPLAHLLYPFMGILGCSLAHCTTVSWPASRFLVAGTSYTRHLELVFKKNMCNEEVAKEPKSSQIAK